MNVATELIEKYDSAVFALNEVFNFLDSQNASGHSKFVKRFAAVFLFPLSVA